MEPSKPESKICFNDELDVLFVGFDTKVEQESIKQIKSIIISSSEKIKSAKVSESTIEYIEVDNKYFSSNVQVNYSRDLDTLLSKYNDQMKKSNILVIANGVYSLKSSINNNLLFKELLISGEKNQSSFKSVWIIDEDETFNKADFFEEFDCFLHIESFSTESSFQNERNKTIVHDFLEDVFNFTWQHVKKSSINQKENKGMMTLNELSKTNTVNLPKKEKTFEQKDAEFMNMFDQILNFNQIKMDLTPNQRKEEASNLILKLMENLEHEGEEEAFDNN